MITNDNLQAILDRGEKLETIVSKSNDLNDDANKFAIDTSILKKKTKIWKKPFCIIIIVVVIVIIIFLLITWGCGFNFKKC